MDNSSIGSIGSIGDLESSEGTGKAKGFGLNFSDLLKGKLNQTNALLQEADSLTMRFASGENIGVHEITTMMEQASVSLQLTMELRNRALDTYRELLRLQV